MRVLHQNRNKLTKKEKQRNRINPTKIYIMFACVAALFLIRMVYFERIEVYQSRNPHKIIEVDDYQFQQLEVESTPIGIVNEYTFFLDELQKSYFNLAFYVVHQYVEVYFDEERVYELKPAKDNKIGKTTASNWVIIPLTVEDENKTIRIRIIPAYEPVKNRGIHIYLGSEFGIISRQLKEDLPQILLSIVAIGIGVAFMFISMLNKYRRKENINLLYLGMLSFCIGTWKITDIRSAPILFPKNTLALSYISILMLSLGLLPWILSFKIYFTKKIKYVLELVSTIVAFLFLIILVLQILNVVDLRESLILVHIIIGGASLLTVGMAIYEGRSIKSTMMKNTLYGCILLCTAGIVSDIIIYYFQKNSSGILFTLLTFILYIVIMGAHSIVVTNQKANIDMHTGLYNKSRCNELLAQYELMEEPLTAMMFDLNKLKYTNDTFGHEKGDFLIADFAKILRHTIGSNDFVGRYGGDEFMAVIHEEKEEKIAQLLDKIQNNVQLYNEKNPHIPISFSVGFAISVKYPGDSLKGLLKRADEAMYINKKKMHKKIV